MRLHEATFVLYRPAGGASRQIIAIVDLKKKHAETTASQSLELKSYMRESVGVCGASFTPTRNRSSGTKR
jgi:hypothetical protein